MIQSFLKSFFKESPIIEHQEIAKETIINELNNIKTKIVDINNKANKIFDLKDLHDEVLSQESINQCIAMTIEEHTSDFFSDRISKKSFTALPSKTNYNYAVKHLNNAIAKEEKEVLDDTKILVEKMNKYILTCASQIKDKIIDDIISSVKSIKNKYSEFLSNFLNPNIESNLVFTANGKFINLLKDSILSIEPKEIDWSKSPIDSEQIIEKINGLQHLIDTPILLSFFNWIIDSKADLQKINFYYTDDCSDSHGISLYNIFFIINNGIYLGVLECLKGVLEKDEAFMTTIIDSDNKIEAIYANALTIEKTIDELSYCCDVTSRLPYINQAISDILEIIKKQT